jgi:addiction module HigA family antidote
MAMPMKSKSSITTKAKGGPVKHRTRTTWIIHPGEILREEFLKPMGLTTYRVAKDLHIPAPRLHDIVLEKRGITADTAVRLARYFGTTEQFWMNLQTSYEVRRANLSLRKELNKIKPRKAESVA